MTNRTKSEKIYIKLGKFIAQARTFHGMDQDELAKKIKMSRSALANIETGRQRISVHRLLILEKALGFPKGYILSEGV